MKFEKIRWQTHCRKYLRPMGFSYSKLAAILKCSKSTAWHYISSKNATLTVEHFLLISRVLGVNPLDFIVQDEVQLQLL